MESDNIIIGSKIIGLKLSEIQKNLMKKKNGCEIENSKLTWSESIF